MRKRCLALLLAAVLCLTLLPGTALAETGQDEREARLYQLLLEGIQGKVGLDGTGYIDISELKISNAEGGPDREMLSTVFRRVFYDHPELYYLREGYYRVHKNTEYVVGLRPMYTDIAQDPGAQARFEEAVNTALAQIKGLTDPLEQMLALYNYLIRMTAYNYDVAIDQHDNAPREAWTAYGALVTGDTVCKGYAFAWKVLMDRIGIPCLIVCKGDGSHLWNLVQLDGKWYHIDVNRGNNLVPVLRGRCTYTDFLLTDEAMKKHGSWYVPGTSYRDPAHYDTTPACEDNRFAEGWIFRQSNIFHPMYRDASGLYYYLRLSSAKTVKLYHGPLSGGGTEVAVLSAYTVPWGNGQRVSGGMIWAEDCLYYISPEFKLMRYRLSNGERASLGEIPFVPQPTEDQRFGSEYDGIGLLFDEDSGVLTALSRTRGMELKRRQIAAPQIRFEDVAPEDFFSPSVEWAVSNGITAGTGNGRFSPDQACTHIQILTLLWRADGRKEADAALPCPVTGNDDYISAARWACQNGMIDAGFKQDALCTRADAVRYIWQATGKPAANYSGAFTDVPASAPCAAAVAWAVSNGVTSGTSATTFAPNRVCSRGHIVTFLYRAYRSASQGNSNTQFTMDDFSDSYRSGKYYQALNAVERTGDYRKDIVAIAASQIGYHGGDSENELDGSKAGTNKYTEYGRFMGSNGTAWCSEFASWCIRQAGVSTSVIHSSRGANIVTFAAPYYSWSETIYAGGSYTPQAGDIILYAWSGTSHTAKNLSHTGIVESVDWDGKNLTIHCIEGNISNKVVRVNRKAEPSTGSLSKGDIVYFVAPDY